MHTIGAAYLLFAFSMQKPHQSMSTVRMITDKGSSKKDELWVLDNASKKCSRVSLQIHLIEL